MINVKEQIQKTGLFVHIFENKSQLVQMRANTIDDDELKGRALMITLAKKYIAGDVTRVALKQELC